MAGAASPFSILPPVSFPLGAGPLLIESCFAILLLGVLLSQAYVYAVNYRKDPLWIKVVVYMICFIETLGSAFSLDTMWSYFIVEFTDFLTVAHIVWSAGGILIIDMVVVALVQGFYIYRIWQLSRNYVVTGIISFLLFSRFAIGLSTSAFLITIPTVVEFNTREAVRFTLNTGLTLAVVVDILITGVLIFYLLKHGAHLRSTRHIVHGLMIYAVNTGALTIIFSLATLLSFNFVHYSFMFAGFVLIETKVYANSLLAMLNARTRILKGNATTAVSNSAPLTTYVAPTFGDTNTEQSIPTARQIAFEIVSMGVPPDAVKEKPSRMGVSSGTLNAC